MKKQILLILLATGIVAKSYSQRIDAPYEVATWAGFTEAAISYTFDDGCRNQFSIAVPLFNEYNFKLTLFIITGQQWDWNVVRAAATDGHEIASHTVTHLSFATLTPEQEDAEQKNSQAKINLEVGNNDCLTMAYPYCVRGDDAIGSKYYLAARGGQGYIEPATPHSYMNVSSIVCGNTSRMTTTDAFTTKFAEAEALKGWCVLLIHALDTNSDGYSPLSSQVLRETVEYLDQNRQKFWVATFKEATLYSKERDVVSVKETAFSDNQITVEVTDNLDNTIYNYPVSIRRPLPVTWQSAVVTQNDTELPSKIVSINGVKYIVFDVVPDTGILTIEAAADSGLQNAKAIADAIVLKEGILQINSNYSGNATINIYDVSGRILFAQNAYLQAGNNQIPINNAPKGHLLIQIIAGNTSENKTYHYQ